MNLGEFKTMAQNLLKKDEYRKYLKALPTIPISRREQFFSLLSSLPIDKALTITGGDLPPDLRFSNTQN
ncbi:MAG: hypothetical protein K0Q79_827 [Flavipsychrobacter sp.]|jgi:hypothetical protein|nr:hypothetical protein [Flavipsychrobacter sp.]